MEYENMTLEQLAEQMQRVKVRLDEVKGEVAQLQNQWDALRKQYIPDKLDELGLESARVAGVGTVSQRADAYCTVPAKNKQALIEWMRENGHADLIGTAINSSTLKAFMKEQVLEGNETPDDIVNFQPYTYVVITK